MNGYINKTNTGRTIGKDSFCDFVVVVVFGGIGVGGGVAEGWLGWIRSVKCVYIMILFCVRYQYQVQGCGAPQAVLRDGCTLGRECIPGSIVGVQVGPNT